MRRLLVLLAAATLTACGGGTTPAADLGPLADQADRVADLIEQDRQCEAAEALRTLEGMTDAMAPQVREAVVSFASTAQQTVTCDPATEPQASPPPEDPGRDDDHGKGKGKAKGKDKGGDDDD